MRRGTRRKSKAGERESQGGASKHRGLKTGYRGKGRPGSR
jgi:hypothetical protein